MLIPQFIRQRGFRKWYERELIRSHSHLVLLLLCTLAALGAIEAFGSSGASQRLLNAGSLVVAALLGGWAMRRYLFHLTRAETLAHQAECPQCKVYARWEIEAQADDATRDDGGGVRMHVRCRGCAERWTIAC